MQVGIVCYGRKGRLPQQPWASATTGRSLKLGPLLDFLHQIFEDMVTCVRLLLKFSSVLLGPALKLSRLQEPSSFERRVDRPKDKDVLQLPLRTFLRAILHRLVPHPLQRLCHALVLLLRPPGSTSQGNEEFVAVHWLSTDIDVFLRDVSGIDEAAVHNEPRSTECRGMPVCHGSSELRLLRRSEGKDVVELVSGHDGGHGAWYPARDARFARYTMIRTARLQRPECLIL